jgi:hypothetical protein
LRVEQIDRDPVRFVIGEDERKAVGVQMLLQNIERELHDPEAGNGSSKRRLYIVVSRKILARTSVRMPFFVKFNSKNRRFFEEKIWQIL